MAKPQQCCVEGCTNKAHAKGYCRKHYGQIWRKGRINPEKKPTDEEDDFGMASRADTDRMRALERELAKAEHMYKHVVGFEGRLKWRKEMEAVKKEILRLKDTYAAVDN